MRRLRNHKFISTVIFAALAAVIVYYAWPNHNPAPASGSKYSPAAASPNNSPNSFNEAQYSTTDPASIWVVVNKQHALNPVSYIPADLQIPNVPQRVPGNESMQLRTAAASAIEDMFSAAKTDSLNLMVSSGYRSYAYQVGLYNGYVKSEGQALADQQSARPGHSEHQTGLAVDIEPTSRHCELDQCFADTKEGKWLAANAYKYGFVLRYTPDKVRVTGYESEPWHYRYVGKDLALQLHNQNIATLEEFFGISGGQNY